MEQPKRITDYFDLLGVDKDCSKEDVQKAFMSKAMLYHPDKADEEHKDEYTTLYQNLQDAYRILSNDRSRKQYIDAQQTTDLEFMHEKRDVGYGTTDQFTKVTDEGKKFDTDAFTHAFNESRSAEEQAALDKLQQQHNNKTVVKEADYLDLIAKREAEQKALDLQTQQVFEAGAKFDSDAFNRAFDVMKQTQPGTGVQEYHGDPMGFFSGGSLVEDDTFGGMNMSYGFGFGGAEMSNIVQGQSINPTADMLDMDQLKQGGKYGEVHAMTDADMQARIHAAEQDRHRLATMDKSQFQTEPSEIERLYSDLFAPADVEGLEAPVACGEEGPEGSDSCDPVIEEKKAANKIKVQKRIKEKKAQGSGLGASA